ncbi:Cytochrome oxidase biogenesis protein Surf1, facilitates heme A insertion [hydrothermal vent metagenome]|uniref:Cytochrome oxidase biogenesis protein Surf1, facilitates heme A insertion n=1 Tax=hydrothermal vent metagenome TaxID=652676 RepID=A0A3B0TE58_9ZZZZ
MFRPLFWTTIVSIAAFVVLVGLGTWQLQRMAWKDDLTARVAARIVAPATPLPGVAAWPGMDLAANEYRPFTVRGTFDHGAEFHAFTAISTPKGTYGGPGYWVLTPLSLQGGGTVLVNRGFVPAARKDRQTRPDGLIEGPVDITGLLRLSVSRAPFVPEPEISKNVWFARDVGAMAAAANIADMAPFFLDASQSAPGGLPQGGETRLKFRNAHLGYALTWYGLALVLIAFYIAFHYATGRLGRQKVARPSS